MAPAGSDPAEAALQQLRKLPENRVCPNCLKKETFGFQSVCVPFRTFVCGDCKSAHQSFSHRCKSTSMSHWTLEEVRQLQEGNGGGNRVATHRWLAAVPDTERPKPGDHHEVFKNFVDRAYNRKEWEGVASMNNLAKNPAIPATPSQQETCPRPQPPTYREAGTCQAPPPMADLLGVDALINVSNTDPTPTPGSLFDGLITVEPTCATLSSPIMPSATTTTVFDPFSPAADATREPMTKLSAFGFISSSSAPSTASLPSGPAELEFPASHLPQAPVANCMAPVPAQAATQSLPSASLLTSLKMDSSSQAQANATAHFAEHSGAGFSSPAVWSTMSVPMGAPPHAMNIWSTLAATTSMPMPAVPCHGGRPLSMEAMKAAKAPLSSPSFSLEEVTNCFDPLAQTPGEGICARG